MELRKKLRKMEMLRPKKQKTNRPKTQRTKYPERKKRLSKLPDWERQWLPLCYIDLVVLCLHHIIDAIVREDVGGDTPEESETDWLTSPGQAGKTVLIVRYLEDVH